MNLIKLEDSIKYEFKNKDLIKEALTHRSYLNENPSWKFSHNERLEFLGDAVLELIVTEILFHKYPKYDEGQLTTFRAALVNYQMLADVSKELNLEKFLLLSHGEAKDIGRARDVILANAFEALVGAIYLDPVRGRPPAKAGVTTVTLGRPASNGVDGGYNEAKKFIERFLMPHLKEVIEKGLYRDAKSLLQEKTQSDLKLTPVYRVLEETGPDHKKLFTVGVYLGDKLAATGHGHSKQDAEVEAAKKALQNL